MKVKCKPRKQDYRNAEAGKHYLETLHWTMTLPFNSNPRGVLVHRVRIGHSFWKRGQHSHDAVTYWCANSAVGGGLNLTEVPPEDRLLCARCEQLAVEAGEPTAEELAGRHVCIGVMKPHRICCRNEEN